MNIPASRTIESSTFQATRGRKGKLEALDRFSDVLSGLYREGNTTKVLVECSQDGAVLIAKHLALSVDYVGDPKDMEDPELRFWFVTLTRPQGTRIV